MPLTVDPRTMASDQRHSQRLAAVDFRRAQSVPKRSGTNRLLVAYGGTKRQVTAHTNCLTSPFPSSDKSEVNGSIASIPTKDLMKGYFWSREYKHLNAEVDGPGLKR
jgi:hypothetical protein